MGHTEKLEDMSSPINDISNVTENIAKLNAATRIGGKGTVRRKTKRVSKASSAVDEKRLAAALQKLGISSVPVVTEATIRTKDEIISFDNAKVLASTTVHVSPRHFPTRVLFLTIVCSKGVGLSLRAEHLHQRHTNCDCRAS